MCEHSYNHPHKVVMSRHLGFVSSPPNQLCKAKVNHCPPYEENYEEYNMIRLFWSLSPTNNGVRFNYL